MRGALIILLLWIVFGGSHLLFASPPTRDAMVGRLGEQRFVLIFSLFAAASFTALALTFGLYHDQGLPGLALGRWPLVRAGLVAVGFAGALIMVLGVLSYFHSPMAIFRTELRPPLGIERITRHAFFVGTVLLMGAHAVLAPTLAGAVFFAGFVVLALAGIPLQDRKLLRRYGDAYARYVESTSTVPFAAILRGRQRFSTDDGWGRLLVTGVVGALALFALHPLWRATYGLPIAFLIGGSGLYIVARRWSKARRPSHSAVE
jgi:uncharacterized membrane protein